MSRSSHMRARDVRLRTVLLSGTSVVAVLYAPFGRAQQPTPAAPPPPTTTAAPGSGDTEPAQGSPLADIVVTGIAQSLKSAQNIKRNSDTVVDAITAEDIGALPDRSVTESLQRVPGVQISHFEALNDPDHISPEGQDAVIRGLPYVQTQFNGRDAFTANKGRALSLQDIPPELLGAIEVYKNQTADRVEGGIAGTIDLITRRPLDSDQDIYGFSGDYNYPDRNGKSAPDGSLFASKVLDTEYGRFGILGDISYSQNYSRQESGKVTSYLPRVNLANGTGAPIPGTTSPTAYIPGLPVGQTFYIPTGGGITREDYDRTRRGFAAAAQWESPDKSILATAQFIRTDTSNLWTEHTLSVVEDTLEGQTVPIPGTPIAFDGNNVLRYGSFEAASNQCYSLSGTKNCGVQQQEISRGVKERAITDDYSGHIAWKATDRLKFDFDAQYVDSVSSDLDVGLYPGTWANESLDLTGTFPKINYSVPSQSGPGAYTNLSAPNANFWRAAIDHEDNNVGRELTFRADGDWRFGDDEDFFRDIKFGARYADRDQRIRSDGYNWGNLSEAWQPGGPVFASSLTPAGFGSYNFGSFLGGNGGNASQQTIYGFNANNAAQYSQFIKGAQQIIAQEIAQGGTYGHWYPLSQRPGPYVIVPLADGGDGYHTPAEIARNLEKTTAGYVRLDYGADNIGGTQWTIDGNAGVRYIHTDTTANGGAQFPAASTIFKINTATGLPICPSPSQQAQPYDICSNTLAQQQAFVSYADGSSVLLRDSQHYDDLLPSFNLRVAPQDDVQFRLAFSKAITRPSFSDLRDFVQVQLYEPVVGSGVNAPVQGFEALAAGNPRLKPTRSWNLDFTGEWYFSPVGFISTTPFYKKLWNIYAVSNGVQYGFPQGGGNTELTGNSDFVAGTPGLVSLPNGSGQRQLVYFQGVDNNNRAASVKGIELDYQQQYTFLPDPFDGAGATFNYTYVDADSLSSQANVYDNAVVYGQTKKLPFPGVSKHNINVAGFYEKYGISARLAYTWRSSYLVTPQDVNYPGQPVFSGDTGQVDCSLYYTILDHADIGISDKAVIKIGFEGSNIFNNVQRTYVQINQYGLEALRAAFVTDTRWTFGIRGVF